MLLCARRTVNPPDTVLKEVMEAKRDVQLVVRDTRSLWAELLKETSLFPLLFSNCFHFSFSFFPPKYNRDGHVKPKQSPLMTGFLFLFDGLKEH